jgi:hypothetical protein
MSPAANASRNCGMALARTLSPRVIRIDVPRCNRRRLTGETSFNGLDKGVTESSYFPGGLQVTLQTQLIVGHRDRRGIPARQSIGPTAKIA